MHEFVAQLPSLAIGELIGIPEERQPAFLSYTENMIETGPAGHSVVEAAGRIYAEFTELLAERRRERHDDEPDRERCGAAREEPGAEE